MTRFQINDTSLESQWRAIILFGTNTATYKFAFAKALLELAGQQKTRVSLEDLAMPFAYNILTHKKKGARPITGIRQYNPAKLTQDALYSLSESYGFADVLNAFQHVNGALIASPFYEKDFKQGRREIVITDNLLKLKDLFQFRNFKQELEARWNLVETNFHVQVEANLLQVKYDEGNSQLFIEDSQMRRVDIASARDCLNGYQKGKCFYSNQEISVNKEHQDICQLTHFLAPLNQADPTKSATAAHELWNLVLVDAACQAEKKHQIPGKQYLEKLYNRNEFYIESKHPLAETIINQTGLTPFKRRRFLEKKYDLALALSGEQ